MATTRPSNNTMPRDYRWLLAELPNSAGVRTLTLALRSKIARLEDEVNKAYSRHVCSSLTVVGCAPNTVEQFTSFKDSRPDRFDKFADNLKNRALKGILKTKQELADEKFEKERKAQEDGKVCAPSTEWQRRG